MNMMNLMLFKDTAQLLEEGAANYAAKQEAALASQPVVDIFREEMITTALVCCAVATIIWLITMINRKNPFTKVTCLCATCAAILAFFTFAINEMQLAFVFFVLATAGGIIASIIAAKLDETSSEEKKGVIV